MAIVSQDAVIRLLSSRNIRVRNEWIDFIVLNVPAHSNDSPLQIENWIWEQFLLADLATIGIPCIGLLTSTADSSSNDKEIVLQVEECINISESFYSQTIALQDGLDGISGRLISGEEEPTSTNEPDNDSSSSKSVFKYILSDGFSCICCLFLDSVSEQNTNFVLETGFKVSISSSDIVFFGQEDIYFVQKVKIIYAKDNSTRQGKLNNLKILLADETA